MIKTPFKFRDVIHNFVEFEDNLLGQTAIQITQTKTFQRLRRLKQLGMAMLIYPGAEHSRYSHSLGAFNIAQQVMKILGEKKRLQDVTETEKVATCLAALMHDIGHCVLSHTSEGMWDFHHEEQTYKLIKHDKELDEILSKYPSSSNLKDQIINILKGDDLPNSKYFLHDIVSSQLDVDRMDYILRDAHMTGVSYGSFDIRWILEHLNTAEFNGKQRIVIEVKAIDAVEQYLTARFHMYRNVYEHRTARIFEVMLQAIVSEISIIDEKLLKKHKIDWIKQPDFDNLEEYKQLDDYKMWEALKTIAYEKDFKGHIKELANDFLLNRRWDVEKLEEKGYKKGFSGEFYHTKMKPSKFYDKEPDKQIIVLAKNNRAKLLSEIGRFISISVRKREAEERFSIKRPAFN